MPRKPVVRCLRVRTSSASRLAASGAAPRAAGRTAGRARRRSACPRRRGPSRVTNSRAERALDLGEQVAVARRVLALAEHLRGAREQVGRVREEGGGDEVLARRRARVVCAPCGSGRHRRASRRSGSRRPRCKSSPARGPHVADPARHARVLLLQDPLVAVAEVHASTG